jgi:hypothetical protein
MTTHDPSGTGDIRDILGICFVHPRSFDQIMAMPASAETQFNLFNQPCSSEDDQALYQKRRTQLSNVVQDVGQLKDKEPMD